MTEPAIIMRKSDKWIPRYFILFFLIVSMVDTIMVTLAVRTQTGVVTEDAYKKGLAYNGLLQEAEAQSRSGVHQKAAYKDGQISWLLMNKDGHPISHAKVKASLFRTVSAGADFTVQMTETSAGVYRAKPSFPQHGAWTVHLSAQWIDGEGKKMKYRTTLDLVTD